MGVVKVRHHRPLPQLACFASVASSGATWAHTPCGAILKQAQVIKKADGWYINFRLEDRTIAEFKADITPTWDNSLGIGDKLRKSTSCQTKSKCRGQRF